ncbi:glycosyltransferase family 4 protein [Citricoccus sp. SGAir0253]|uniref:glycosyltransferase n=1 Tax=Citricoccus sp. SGAir0253 TaxID=2567881 RepID=UPI0010CD274E|nr:glycosyltransferase [Citricoccus sp. SGAir0253]QCU78549.1 glycosyltransferase family 4 protein [Citricoccus sp. SGAir0253]
MTAAPDSPLRVLIAADTYPPDVNGASVFCFRLARALHARGHEVHVLAARNDAGPDTVQVTEEAIVHRLQSVRAFTHETYRMVFPWHASRSIGALLDELRPDVVHAQCHYMIGEAAINEAEKRRIRTIATNHFMPENLEPFLPFPQWFLDIVSRNSWRDMGRLMGKAAAVTTPTALAARTMAEHAGLDHVLPISNGIDSSAYELAPGETVERPDHPVVLFVGRLAVEKHVDVLIRAIGLLDPALCVHLEVVGDGEQRAPLRSLVDELGLGDRVHFLGHVTDAELHTAYLRADVFCQPGTAELQSLVSLEAMSASKPVVLADALALPHLVTDGDNGYLFAPGDPQDLAAKLTAVLCADPGERARMGRASHDRAVQHAQGRTIDLFEMLYRGATPEEVRALL